MCKGRPPAPESARCERRARITGAAVRHHRLAAASAADLVFARIIGVEHRDTATRHEVAREEQQLRREVLLLVAVVVEVIAREVGEDRGAKQTAIDTLLRQRVRGDLERGPARPPRAARRERLVARSRRASSGARRARSPARAD
jgi:hypothetical protein